jgi:hypothetical protein
MPESGIALWSQSLKFQAASLYATAITKGFSKETSTILAEVFVNKELYGVTYNQSLESALKSLFV